MPRPSNRPKTVNVRSYQVGFGDCFLVEFHYAKSARFVLIDFGRTGTPSGKNKETQTAVAKDIQKRTGGKLHAVVATHRHRDHISGFDPSGKAGSGKIIAACKPDIVLQPWTEDPKAARNAKEATKTRVTRFTAAITSMQRFAEVAFSEVSALRAPRELKSQIAFLGQENLANLKAVEHLQAMGKTHIYANSGRSSGLARVLPGVRVHVLGPPTLAQTGDISKQRRSDPDEFWQLQAKFWRLQENSGQNRSRDGLLFDANHVAGKRSPEVRWFIRRAAQARGEELLQLVRIIDSALNNTSLILLFEVGGKFLLFPGDAQIENWAYALGQKKYRDLLRKVDFYKVGHHGSRNATPMTLWKLFEKKSVTQHPERLVTMLSTMRGKHGVVERKTEVPRATLVAALRRHSQHFTTEILNRKELCQSHKVVFTT